MDSFFPLKAVLSRIERPSRLLFPSVRRGHLSNLLGEVGEIYVEAVMQQFDGREVPGALYFNHEQPVSLPAFKKLEPRGGIIKRGIAIEIDILAEWAIQSGGQGAWLVEVKNTPDPIGQGKVEYFCKQVELVKQEKAYTEVIAWYMSRQGFTADAMTTLEQAGVLYSNREQFNMLSKLFDFIGLPP